MKNSTPCMFLITALLLVISTDRFAQNGDEYSLNEIYDIPADGTIELQSDDADLVEIRGTDRQNVHVMIHYQLEVEGLTLGKREKFGMNISITDGRLTISEKPRNGEGINLNLGVVEEEYTITIEAPRSINLNLEGDDDIYEISDIAGAIHIDADDSDATLRNCTGNNFLFNFDDADLTMDSGSGSFALGFDDGDADIRGGQFSRVEVKTDDGDLNFATTLSDDGDYSFSSDDGDLHLIVLGGGGEFQVDHDEVRVSAGSDFEEIRSDEDYNEYRLAGGDAYVRIETDDGDVKLSTQ